MLGDNGFDNRPVGRAGADTLDGAAGTDTIRLDSTCFTGLALGHLRASAFAVDDPTGTAPQIVYNSTNGSLSHDSDGVQAGRPLLRR